MKTNFEMTLFDGKNAVLENGTWLPNFLFFFDSSKSKNISPAAAFNPAAALEGEPFENTTSPSRKPIKKTLIISKSASFLLSLESLIPFTTKLKYLGFEVFLCCQEEGKKKLEKVDELTSPESRKLLARNLENLVYFDDKTDFVLAAQHNIARDRAVTINYSRKQQIVESLTQNSGGEHGLFSNHLCMISEVNLSSDELDDRNNLYSFLQRKSKEEKEKIDWEEFAEPGKSDDLFAILKFAPEEFSKSLLEKKKIFVGSSLIDYSNIIKFLEEFPQFRDSIFEIGKEKIYRWSWSKIAQKNLIDPEKILQESIKRDILVFLKELAESLPKEVGDQLVKKYEIKTSDINSLSAGYLNEKLNLIKIERNLVDAEEIIKDYTIKTDFDVVGLTILLEAAPNLAGKIIKEHKDKIRNGRGLCRCVVLAPSLAEELIQEHENKIEDGYQLAECLEAAPNLAKLLIDKHGNKIEDGDQLAICLEAAPNLAGELIKNYGNKIEDGYQLAKCLEAAPNLAGELIRGNEKLININSDERACRALLKAAPQFADLIIEQNKNIFQKQNIGKFLTEAAEGEISDDVIAKIYDKCYEANLKDCHLIEIYSNIKGRFVDQSQDVNIEEKRPHYLYLRDKVGEFLTRVKEEKKENILAEITVVKIQKAEKENFDDITNLLRSLPKLCLVVVPDKIRQQIKNEFPELLVYETTELVKNRLSSWNIGNANSIQNKTEVTWEEKIASSLQAKPKLRLIKNSDSGTTKDLIKTVVDGRTVLYEEDCGTAINCENPPHIRTAQVSYLDISKTFEGKCNFDADFLDKSSLVEVQKKILNEQYISSLSRLNGGHYPNYYLMEVTIPRNDGYYRLLSIADGEEIKAIQTTDQKAKIEIKKGEDGFFYVKNLSTTSPLGLRYVLKVDKELERKNDILSIRDSELTSTQGVNVLKIVKEVVGSYRDTKKSRFLGTPSLQQLNYLENCYTESKHQEWLDKLFEDKAGVCRHKVVAVYSKVYQTIVQKFLGTGNNEEEAHKQTKEILQQNIRAIRVDDNHILLEIKYKDKWIKLEPSGLYHEAGRNLEEDLRDLKTELEKKENLQQLVREEEQRVLDEDSKKKNEEQQVLRKENEESEKERLEKKALSAMAKSFLAITEINRVNDESLLTEQTFSSDKNKILIVAENIETHANFLLNQAQTKQRKVFYVREPQQIDLHRINLLINGDNPVLSSEGLLSNFLNISTEEKEKRPLLIINWSAFNNKQKLALNTVLDRERSINGVQIDDAIQVIGLTGSIEQDPSFLSRHDVILQSKVIFNQSKRNARDAEIVNVDLQGFPNWRRQVFGKVIQQDDAMVWQKSNFVEVIEKAISDGSKEIRFQLTNLSKEAAKEFQIEFEEAKAKGKFIYHGHEITLPEKIDVIFDDKSFDFAKFSDQSKIIVSRNTFDQLPQGFRLINSYLFDVILSDKEIADGKYEEKLGLIDQCSTSSQDKTLKLFISSDLSDSQWYCLFNEALQKKITLQIATAPQVRIPGLVKITEEKSFSVAQDSAVVTDVSLSKVYVSNDVDQTLTEILESSKSPSDVQPYAIVNVEDFTYQDLVERITFETSQDGFRNFQRIESEFLEKLKAGEKIILKGEFSAELLQMLEPIITCQAPEFEVAGKNLTLIIEDKSVSENSVYKPFEWLSKNTYQIKNHSSNSSKFTEIVHREIAESTADLTDSVEKSDDFIKARQDLFLKTLSSHSMTRLIGHSGVGKSRLLKMFEEQEGEQQTTEIYRELNAFESWANSSTDKTKILFIDESNIEDLHFTMFAPLKGDELKKPKRIFYRGKFYDLDDHHKVVFAQNPTNYGGGRFEQKLFDDGKIPAIYFADFPSSYIYEKILKESLYDKLENAEKTKFTEEEFKKLCQPLIEKYQSTNSKRKSDQESNEETVRELQEKVLVELCEKISPIEVNEISSANFISTEITKEVELALSNSLEIRKLQKAKIFPKDGVGLNGVILEGDSGTGKSEMISAILASKGITEKKFNNSESEESSVDSSDVETQQFYKIDASLPIEIKKQIITKAFEEGNIVWIDEINGCIDDGLEKILNAALTGSHPEEKKDAVVQPGFMLISSINSISLEGRSIISPALKHRTIQPQVKKLSQYSQEDLTKIITHWISQQSDDSQSFVEEKFRVNVAQRIAQDFTKCLSHQENLNLRILRSRLEEIIPNYVDLAKLLEVNPIKNLQVIQEQFEINYDLEKKSPATSIIAVDVVQIDSVMRENNIWNQKKTGVDEFISGDRKNRYRIFESAYKKQGEEVIDQDLINKVFKQIIANCAKECGCFSNDKIFALIDKAKEKGGVSHSVNLETEKYQKADRLAINAVDDKTARKFSALFQKKCDEMGIFTGRMGNNVRSVGLRLTFIPDDVVQELKSQGAEHICNKSFLESDKIELIKNEVRKIRHNEKNIEPELELVL